MGISGMWKLVGNLSIEHYRRKIAVEVVLCLEAAFFEYGLPFDSERSVGHVTRLCPRVIPFIIPVSGLVTAERSDDEARHKVPNTGEAVFVVYPLVVIIYGWLVVEHTENETPLWGMMYLNYV